MMKKTIFFLGLIFFLVNQVAFVEGSKGIEKKIDYLLSIWDESLSMLREEVGLLPNSPFYFLKEWRRGIKELFTFNPVKKAELELRYLDEKAAETVELVSKIEDSNRRVEALKKALDSYLKSQERLVKRLDSLRQNEDTEQLLNKVGEKIVLHQALFDEITNLLEETQKNQEVLRKTEKGESRWKKVITKPDIMTWLHFEQAVDQLPYPEGLRELKVLEILTRIEKQLPEEAKQGIITVEETIQKKLIETGEIQQAVDWQVEQGFSGYLKVGGVPMKASAFEKVLTILEEKAGEINPLIQRPDFMTIQAVEDLKIRVQEVLRTVSENTDESERGEACPAIAPDTSKGKEECLKAAQHLEEIYPGCDYSSACRTIKDDADSRKPSLDCGPAPAAPGEWRCIDGVWKEVSSCGKIRCLIYDPVCGVNGKTYACGIADAEACGVKVAYRGVCKEKYSPLPQSSTATSSSKLPQPIFCTQEWNPVCGVDEKTYSNTCLAKAAGVAIKHQGICEVEIK